MPDLHSANAGIIFTYGFDVLKGELFPGYLGQSRVLIVLIISLLAYANQPAEIRNPVIDCGFCTQVCYCLAPAFFLIGILYFCSAISMIFSLSRTRIFSILSCSSKSATRVRKSSSSLSRCSLLDCILLIGTFSQFMDTKIAIHLLMVVLLIGNNPIFHM